MQKAQDDLKATVQQLQEQGKQFVADAQEEVKSIKPIDAGIAFGVALLLSIGLHLATKQKEDSAITFGVFVYALVAGALALVLRKKEQRDQFITMVLAFSFLRLVFDVSAITVLALSGCPVIVNIAAEEAKKHLKFE